MDMRELRYFSAVFDERNLTAAAKRCFVSQPSVSAAIASLEHELDTKLFIRHKKGMTPTSAADQLYPVARRMVDEAEAVRKLFRKPSPARPLTLGLMRTLDIGRTLEILKPITAMTSLRLHLVEADKVCDARIVSKIMLKESERFIPLWTERYVVALPPTHPLALKEILRMADLEGMQLVDRCFCEHSALFARSKIKFETVAVAQSEEWALALVSAGLGIAILPEGAVRAGSGVVTRMVADMDVTRQVGLAYPASNSASTEVRQLIDSLTPDVESRRGRARKRA